jgi:hypothetical protein
MEGTVPRIAPAIFSPVGYRRHATTRTSLRNGPEVIKAKAGVVAAPATASLVVLLPCTLVLMHVFADQIELAKRVFLARKCLT